MNLEHFESKTTNGKQSSKCEADEYELPYIVHSVVLIGKHNKGI